MIDRRQTIAFALAATVAHPVWAEARPVIRDLSFDASDAALAEPGGRLTATRWPGAVARIDWEQGPPLEAMREIVPAWRDDYDWRATQARRND
ncbi:epoxide hydrolase N-terminal domain-containing protein [Amaricoccus sp. W119]|uniref:epoxide hydrolase N-terminal domain-containing protein n=1 Tax=Amaricoccus sp. W119 TaxID=3391833 RepID=UPI0039A68569